MDRPRFQLFFLHRDGDRLVLKCGRRSLQIGIATILISLFVGTVVVVLDAAWPWLLVAVAILGFGVNRLFGGSRTFVDLAARTIELRGGERLDAARLCRLRMRAVRDSDDQKAQTWGLLEAETREGEPLLLAEGGSLDQVERVGREIAERLGVEWREPDAAERVRRKRFTYRNGRR